MAQNDITHMVPFARRRLNKRTELNVLEVDVVS